MGRHEVTSPDQNKAVVQRFFDQVINQHNSGAISNFVHAAFDDGTCGGKTFAGLTQEVHQ
jgi:hypothetical protein